MTQVYHSDPFSQNLPKVIFSDTFVKKTHLSLLNNVYITRKLDLALFQGLSVDKTWFCSLHPPCGQDPVGPLMIAFCCLYTDSQICWSILKLKLDLSTFSNSAWQVILKSVNNFIWRWPQTWIIATISSEQGCYSAKTKIGAKKNYKNRCKIRAN